MTGIFCFIAAVIFLVSWITWTCYRGEGSWGGLFSMFSQLCILPAMQNNNNYLYLKDGGRGGRERRTCSFYISVQTTFLSHRQCMSETSNTWWKTCAESEKEKEKGWPLLSLKQKLLFRTVKCVIFNKPDCALLSLVTKTSSTRIAYWFWFRKPMRINSACSMCRSILEWEFWAWGSTSQLLISVS